MAGNGHRPGPVPPDAFVAPGADQPDLPPDEGLQRIVELAVRTVPETMAASVILLRGDRPQLAAAAGEPARMIGAAECRDGDGPAVVACGTEGALIDLPDLSAPSNWAQWAIRARAAGAGAALSVGLPFRRWVAGALTLYGRRPGAFDDDASVLARTFAGCAAVALAHCHVRDTMTALTRRVQAASDSRAVVERARGVLMGTRGCTAAEAMEIMAATGRETGRTLTEVAADVVAGVAGPPPSGGDFGSAGQMNPA